MFINKSLLIIILLFALSCQKADDVGKTYTYDNGNVEILNGHVKQIRYFHEIHFGVSVIDTTNFDEKGNQVEVLSGDGQARYKEKYIYTYDKSARIVQTSVVDSGVRGNYTYVIGNYTYNKDGYSIKTIDSLQQPLSEIYKYDNEGYLIEKDSYFDPKLASPISKYKYDKNHHLIQIEERSDKGELIAIQTFKYPALDSKNNWTKIEVTTKYLLFTPVEVQTNKGIRAIDYY